MAMREPGAVVQPDLGLGIEPIDPNEEPRIAPVHLKWPEQRSLAFDQLLSFDRRSDTLLIHFFGREREAVAVEQGTHAYALVDPSTEEVVGLLLENFLAHVVKRCPVAVELLEHAELRGITAAEVRALRREVLGLRHRITERLRHPTAAPAPRKRRLMRLLEPSGSASLEGLPCL